MAFFWSPFKSHRLGGGGGPESAQKVLLPSKGGENGWGGGGKWGIKNLRILSTKTSTKGMLYSLSVGTREKIINKKNPKKKKPRGTKASLRMLENRARSEEILKGGKN